MGNAAPSLRSSAAVRTDGRGTSPTPDLVIMNYLCQQPSQKPLPLQNTNRITKDVCILYTYTNTHQSWLQRRDGLSSRTLSKRGNKYSHNNPTAIVTLKTCFLQMSPSSEFYHTASHITFIHLEYKKMESCKVGTNKFGAEMFQNVFSFTLAQTAAW
jgi:hypothetical protein